MNVVSAAPDSDLSPKKVLIINSYDEGFGWTSDQNHGILDRFSQEDGIYEFLLNILTGKTIPRKII
jgi:hypothetical protein